MDGLLLLVFFLCAGLLSAFSFSSLYHEQVALPSAPDLLGGANK